MNILEMIASAARKNPTIAKLSKLPAEQHVDYLMRKDHVLNSSVQWNDDLDERGQMMKDLFDKLVVIDESDYVRQHLMIDESECVRKESDLRAEFYTTADNMWNRLVKYACYLGYCTRRDIKEELEALDKEFGIVINKED